MPDDLLTVLQRLDRWTREHRRPLPMSDTKSPVFRAGWEDAMEEVRFRIREEIVHAKKEQG
jgi:hypothetical protein